MSGFSTDWLRLREPFDKAARAIAMPALGLDQHVQSWQQHAKSGVVQMVDLGCGSGANFRALAPHLGPAQHWRLYDHDPALLAAVPAAISEWTIQTQQGHVDVVSGQGGKRIHVQCPQFTATIELHCVDLARHLSSVSLTGVHLVTGSALLDLVSQDWLSALVAQAQLNHTAMLFALSVDGRTTWYPVDQQDDRVHALFTQHQNRDKGFGPALGMHAVPTVLRQLSQAGYVVRQSQSDWLMKGVGDQAMLLALIDGIKDAAIEQSPSEQNMLMDWALRRKHAIAACELRVGHVDFLATWPPSRQV